MIEHLSSDKYKMIDHTADLGVIVCGITLKELKEGTEEELDIADYIKKSKREGRYVYSQKTYAEILTGPKRRFLALELVIEPQGKTKIEKDPEAQEGFEKWVYVNRGELTCIIKDTKFILEKGDCVSFDSSFIIL